MNSRELYNRLVDVYLINKEIVEGRFFSSKGQKNFTGGVHR